MDSKPTIAREGLSVVVAPAEPTSDIVFVHGLQGHPEKTWTFRGSSQAQKKFSLFRHKKNEPEPPSSIFWPLELLSRDPRLQTARILTYGYDSVVSNFFGPHNQQNISRHGNDLMVALQQERRAQPNRPLIFVAHSLGGILVKVALVKSKGSRQPKLLPIFESTKGIVFLGTPHSGSNSAAWGLLVTNLAKFAMQGSNQRVLRGLTPNSELLETLAEQFRQLLDEGTFSVHSFYETQAMSTIYGIEDKVVPYNSAILGDVKRETIMGINADHRGICKFGSFNDPGYKAVIGAIMDYLDVSPSRESELDKRSILQQQPSSSKEDVDSFAAETQTLVASPYANAYSGERSLAPATAFETWHSHTSLAAVETDQIFRYLSHIGLSDAELREHRRLSISNEEIDLSAKLGWFFENPDFTDWDGNKSTTILQLGGQRKDENWTIVSELSRLLENRGSKYVCFSPSFSEPEASRRLKPLEQGHRIFRAVISQLAEGDMSILLNLVGHEAMHEMLRPQPLAQDMSILKSLARLLYHLLVGQQDDRLYVLIDGLDILGHEIGRFMDELLLLLDRLREPEIANPQQPVVKIFISTPPHTRPRTSDQRTRTAKIIYIEKNKEMQDCLQTLYATDFNARPRTIQDPDSSTCHWLEEDEHYAKWASSDESSLLLIQGKPGSGKSTLAKSIVKAVRDSKYFEEPLVAFFFYSYRGGQRETSHTIMLQSILYQLLSQEPDFFPAFREQYRAQRRAGSGTVRWVLRDLIEIFVTLSRIKRDGRIVVLLDAMDESDDHELPLILRSMASNCSTKSQSVFKGVMTTRPLPRKAAGLDLDKLTDFSLVMENKNRADIEKFVDQEVGQILEDAMSTEEDVDSTVFDGIKDYIKEHAEGVFLWVDLVLREFKSLSEEGFSKSQLDQLKTMLPPKLTDVYRQITERLAKNRPNEILQGRKLLELAAFSLQRLRLEEIGDAMIIPSYPEAEQFIPSIQILDDRVRFLTRRIRMVCGDLLEIRRPFVQLVHESVRDFLLNEDQIAAPFYMSAEQGNDEVTSIYTRYLAWSLSPNFLDTVGITKAEVSQWEQHNYETFLELLEDRPLLNYVLSSLPEHLKLTTHEGIKDEFSCVLRDLEQSEPVRYLLLDSEFSSLLTPASDDEAAEASHFRFKALVLAARLGYVKAIRQLKTSNTPMTPTDGETETSPLHAAISGGQLEAVKLLLDLGSDPYFPDQVGDMALHKAVAHGQLGIVQALIDNEVYVGAPNLTHERPIHVASARGYDDMVKLLLDCGAEIDWVDQYDATALHKAVENDHLSVAKMLLQRGAEIDADAKYTGTPLHIAVDKKYIAMAKLLLEHEAPVNETGEYGATPLHSSASEGQEEMISLLKEHGANISEKDRYGLTAWDWAKANGHSHVLDLLDVTKAEGDNKSSLRQFDEMKVFF